MSADVLLLCQSALCTCRQVTDTMNETICSGLTTPKWLNNSLLERVLRSEDGESTVTIISYDISRATAAGDNYTSDIYRLVVQLSRGGQPETINLIVKASLEKEEMSQIMSKVKAFQRESEALKSTLPSMYKILNERAPRQFQPFAAKYLYNYDDDDDSSSIIVLDDLKKQGFRMAERTCGLDFQHCLLVMRTIARFHAASAVLHHKDPGLFNTFHKSVFCEDFREDLDKFFARSVRNLATEVEKWPDYGDLYATQLHKLADESVELMIEDCIRNDDDFNVLIHGDLWLNNMMFRYSEGTKKLMDMRFVDLQLCHFTSPAQDLQYFLHTSPQLELLDQHSHLVEEYHKVLGETFILLGHEHLHPSLDQLYKQMEKKGRFAVIVACSVLSFVLADRQNIPDMEKILKNEDTVYYSSLYKQALKKLLPLFEQKGWL